MKPRQKRKRAEAEKAANARAVLVNRREQL